MATSAQSQQPSPTLFFETANAFQRTAALKGAIDLDLFTAIAEGGATAQELSTRCKTSERGMRILCDYLAVIGFVTKRDCRYGLTPDSAMFLDKRSPAYLGTAVKFLTSATAMDAVKDVAATVRKGGTVMSEEGTMEPEHPMWVDFARSMAPMMRMPAEHIAKALEAESGGKWKVLDIAAGHGTFGVTIARHNPQAEIYALDWAKVLDVAKETAEAAGVAARFHALPGSAFDVALDSDYDVVLLTNFLHHFDPPTNEKLLKKMHAALKPGGRVATLEFVPNDDRVTPPMAAAFSLIMLTGTPGGEAYTFAEFEKMFRNAGFARSELRELPGNFERLIISHK
jgi:ubiquinone/menaquinone biosynthesis C-methylase UbiE